MSTRVSKGRKVGKILSVEVSKLFTPCSTNETLFNRDVPHTGT